MSVTTGNTDNTFDAEPTAASTLFSALLVPYRSLAPIGFNLLMAFLFLVLTSMGVMFYQIGAWPVIGFCGLDLLLIWFAFHVNYKAAKAYEEVELDRTQLRVRKVDANGREAHHEFNPFWTRFQVERHDEIGITSMVLTSREPNEDPSKRQRKVAIGSFLNPDDRESFAKAFGQALATAKA
ncbi:MAG: DUF2244 domain-containing protein [Pseudomonadota bacterium]